MASSLRNSKCPCGSGKKYKHCCIAVHRAIKDDIEKGAQYIKSSKWPGVIKIKDAPLQESITVAEETPLSTEEHKEIAQLLEMSQADINSGRLHNHEDVKQECLK